MALFKKRQPTPAEIYRKAHRKDPKWKYNNLFAIILKRDQTYSVIHWRLKEMRKPKELEAYEFHEKYIIKLKKWWPELKTQKLSFRINRFLNPRKAGMVIYREGEKLPYVHSSMVRPDTEYTIFTPELLKKYVLSNVDEAMFASLQGKIQVNRKLLLILIVGIVIAVVAARFFGVF